MTQPLTMDELIQLVTECGLGHARFCLEHNATQVGEDVLAPLFEKLEELEDTMEINAARASR